MMNKIIFYASVGNGVPAYLIGGGEVGSQRTMHVFKQAGYDVIVVDKAIFGLGLKTYVKMILAAFFKITKQLVRNKDSILYVVGFYERNLWFEWLLLMMAWLTRHKSVYEARNGRLVNAYREGNSVYRFFMRSVLRKAHLIFCQGQEYVDFIRHYLHRESVYIPNYILNSKLRPYNDQRTLRHLNLVYFGRIVASKNIDVIIEAEAILKWKGFDVSLTLIGGYMDAYKAKLDEVVQINGLSEEDVVFTGSKSFDEISFYLHNAHFFLLPSQEIKEGHSNSLTEAMAFGVVPLVSEAGFSRSIVAEENLVIEKIDAHAYANAIERIVKENQWEGYSRYVYNRVQNHYTESCINRRMTDEMKRLSNA